MVTIHVHIYFPSNPSNYDIQKETSAIIYNIQEVFAKHPCHDQNRQPVRPEPLLQQKPASRPRPPPQQLWQPARPEPLLRPDQQKNLASRSRTNDAHTEATEANATNSSTTTISTTSPR